MPRETAGGGLKSSATVRSCNFKTCRRYCTCTDMSQSDSSWAPVRTSLHYLATVGRLLARCLQGILHCVTTRCALRLLHSQPSTVLLLQTRCISRKYRHGHDGTDSHTSHSRVWSTVYRQLGEDATRYPLANEPQSPQSCPIHGRRLFKTQVLYKCLVSPVITRFVAGR